ncbi:MAG TPA: 30S ribosomal protein S8 [Candidatus Paceibacterota bacterium]
MVTDPIADMITRLRNAARAHLPTVVVEYSNFKLAVAQVLLDRGFITSATKKGKKVKKVIEMNLAFKGREPKILGAVRVSKPSRRVYQGARDLRLVRQGFGELVISTPKGIMTGTEARKARVGGEVLFKIW